MIANPNIMVSENIEIDEDDMIGDFPSTEKSLNEINKVVKDYYQQINEETTKKTSYSVNFYKKNTIPYTIGTLLSYEKTFKYKKIIFMVSFEELKKLLNGPEIFEKITINEIDETEIVLTDREMSCRKLKICEINGSDFKVKLKLGY
jgi:hypothetical protein